MFAVRQVVTTGTIALMLQVGLARAEEPRPAIRLSVSEDSTPGTEIGTLSDTSSSSLAGYAIVDGNGDGVFSIDAATGTLSVRDQAKLDFEHRALYELRIRAERRDGDDSARRRFTADLLESGVDDQHIAEFLRSPVEFVVVIQVLDAAEPPALPSQRVTMVWSDDATVDEHVTIRAFDHDAGDTLRYEILAGDPEGVLQLDPETGRLTAATGDRVAAGRHRLPITIRVTDSVGLSDAATMDVELIRLAPPAPLVATSPATQPMDSAVAPVEPAGDAAASGHDAATTPPTVVSIADSQSEAAAPSVENEVASGVRTPAASQSDLVSRFVPILLMLGAGLLTTLFLRRRQRDKAREAREAMQHGADMLARPLPGWLSDAQREPRPPLVVALTPVEQSDDDQLIDVDEVVVDVETDSPDVDRQKPSAEDTVIIENFGAPLLHVEEPISEEPSIVPEAAWDGTAEPTRGTDASYEDYVPQAESSFAGAAFSGSEPDSELTGAGEDMVSDQESDTTGHGERPEAWTEATPSSPEDVSDEVEAETYALQGEMYELEPSDGAESSYTDEGTYIGGWTQDDLPYDDSEAAVVQEASQALEESGSPLGVDPKVAELRAQLSNMFGVTLNAPRPPAPPVTEDEAQRIAEDTAATPEPAVPTYAPQSAAGFVEQADDEVETPVEAAAPAAPEGESDPVRSWLEYLKNRNAPVAAASAPASATPAVTAPPAAPLPEAKPETPPVVKSVPHVRQNKSAVRLEISHLRDVANRHTRGVLAVKASEQKARLWWFLSGASMVVLCFISMALLKSQTPMLRWLGWAFLCGAAVNLAVCVNSFQRLKTGSDASDGEGDSAATAERAERSGDPNASDLLTPEMEARIESIMQGETERTPVESRT